MFEHLGIAGKQVPQVERTQELAGEDNCGGAVEDADFVLQPSEVDACLAAHTGIDLAEQRCRDVDVGDAALEGAGSEASQVRHHAASQVHQERVACGTTLLQGRPDMCERFERFVVVRIADGYHLGPLEAGQGTDEWPAEAECCGVGEYEEPVE